MKDRADPASPGGPHAAAFERVADAMLASRAEPPLVVALAGCDAGLLRPWVDGLVAAAAQAEIPLQVRASATRPAAETAASPGRVSHAPPRIVLENDGAVDEARLAQAAAPHAAGPDLLLWVLGRRTPPTLRSLYLMGLWTWVRGPARLRCLVEGSEPERAAAAAGVALAMAAAALPLRAEVLALGADPGAGTTGLHEQLLRSALAAARRTPASERRQAGV